MPDQHRSRDRRPRGAPTFSAQPASHLVMLGAGAAVLLVIASTAVLAVLPR